MRALLLLLFGLLVVGAVSLVDAGGPPVGVTEACPCPCAEEHGADSTDCCLPGPGQCGCVGVHPGALPHQPAIERSTAQAPVDVNVPFPPGALPTLPRPPPPTPPPIG